LGRFSAIAFLRRRSISASVLFSLFDRFLWRPLRRRTGINDLLWQFSRNVFRRLVPFGNAGLHVGLGHRVAEASDLASVVGRLLLQKTNSFQCSPSLRDCLRGRQLVGTTQGHNAGNIDRIGAPRGWIGFTHQADEALGAVEI